MATIVRTGLGQDSHRFEQETAKKPLLLGGVTIPGSPGLAGNSDADVILHALTNAISGITGTNILGAVSDKLCLEQGITDSRVYLKKAMEYLGNTRIVHVSISVEALRPKLAPHIPAIRESVAELLSVPFESVCLTATTGEGLTGCGKGEGISVFAIITAEQLTT